MTTDIHAAFEAKYKASAQDPACAEELRVFSDGWNAREAHEAPEVEAVRAAELQEAWDLMKVMLPRAGRHMVPGYDGRKVGNVLGFLIAQIGARDAEIAALREVLVNARLALQEANEAGAGGPIQDTIWMPAKISSAETLFDYLHAAIEQTPVKPPPRYPSTEGQRIARQIREGKEGKGVRG